MTVLPVVLSGGAGSRLWPMSRQDVPKQFLAMPGPDTMIQATVRRLDALAASHAKPIVVANVSHRDFVAQQLAEIGVEPTVIVEPQGRNTAPAVALAALHAVATGRGDMALLVMPADHVIADTDEFVASVEMALTVAAQGALVTFGVVPTEAHTGFGYIRAAKKGVAAAVDEFVEKPDLASAQRYVASGDYYWNAGIFLFTANAFLAELEACAPDIAESCAASMDGVREGRFLSPNEESFRGVRAESIDVAVMENTNRAFVVPMDAGWSDVGSWSALHEAMPHDENGNALTGKVVAIDSTGSSVLAGRRTVAVLGVTDTIIVDTDDCLLVTTSDACQRVKDVVSLLKDEQDPAATTHSKRRFAWGSIEPVSVDSDRPLFNIVLNPHSECSIRTEPGARLIGLAGILAVSGTNFDETVGARDAFALVANSEFRISNTADNSASLLMQQACLVESVAAPHERTQKD